MDDNTLSALEAALRASPDNADLLGVLLAEWNARQLPERALLFLEGADPEALPPGARVHAARALLALGRVDAARAAYHSAVAANPTVEDPDLALQLQPAAREVPVDASAPEERPRLRLLAAGAETSDAVDTLLAPAEAPICFDDVGGHDDIKKRIRRKIILPMQKPSLFDRFRKKAGGGVLLYGPPGCGKTLLARATAGEVRGDFFNIAISDVLDMYVGESEQKLKALFDRARQRTPSVLFFDEVEALGGKRQYGRNSAHAHVVSQFLSEMDGFASQNTGVLVLGATNVPWAIDPAFRRPGRFDRVLFVPPPDRTARQVILDLHLRERPVATDVDTAPLAARTGGFSGADLSNVVETAVDLAIEASLETGTEVPVSQALLLEALAEVKPTTTEWLTTARNYARYANESGQYDEVLDFLKKHGK